MVDLWLNPDRILQISAADKRSQSEIPMLSMKIALYSNHVLVKMILLCSSYDPTHQLTRGLELSADLRLRLSGGVLVPVLGCWRADVGAECFIRMSE